MSMESVVGELQCPICLEFFRCPIILPCSHILCRSPCAERLFDNGFVRCPVCRDNSFVSGGVDSLPRVISLENIIESYQQDGGASAAEPPIPQAERCDKDDIACQLCSGTARKAVKSCLDCNASYCRRCLHMSHPDKEPFCNHTLVNPRRYPKPREQRCPQHDVRANVYCQDCQTLACLLCADDPNAHPAHQVLSLDQATELLRNQVLSNLKLVEGRQGTVRDATSTLQLKLHNFKKDLEGQRSNLNAEFDSFISEIERKREFFLSDLEYEEKTKVDAMTGDIVEFQQQSTNLQSLIHYAQEILKETDSYAFLQLAKAVNERIDQNMKSGFEVMPPSPLTTSLNHKVVDLRKEKAVVKDMAYLKAPPVPVIDVVKCSRSASSVVIVLSTPFNEYDVIDGYQVYYCSDQQKRIGEQEKMIFKNSQEERRCVRGQPSSNAVCLIHNNLQSDTMYYFCVRAHNKAGESEMSEIINCRTLRQSESSIPVPEIVENQCRTYTYSIQIYSSSPVDITEEDGISHYLLYREASVDKIWKSISMYGRLDHRVFGLESNTYYDFVVMACHRNGECQVSAPITLLTEQSAY